jgi:hypothetical protein
MRIRVSCFDMAVLSIHPFAISSALSRDLRVLIAARKTGEV